MPPDAGRATLAVRPEKARLLRRGAAVPEGHNSMDVTLRQIVYAGATSAFFVASRDGTEAKAFCQSHEAPEATPGTEMRLAWSPAHTVLLRT